MRAVEGRLGACAYGGGFDLQCASEFKSGTPLVQSSHLGHAVESSADLTID